VDLSQLVLHFGCAGIEAAGFRKDFRKVHGSDADAVAFKELLAVTHRIEGAGSCPDGAQARAAQGVDDPTDRLEIPQIGSEPFGCPTCHKAARNPLAPR